VAFILLPCTVTAQTTSARRGLLQLKQWNFKDAPARLNGEWEFYMSALISPKDFEQPAKTPPEYIDFPSTWNAHSKALRPGDGFATYRLHVIVGRNNKLALELPHFYSNYKLWINGTAVASNGVVGSKETTSIPQWHPQTLTYQVPSDTLTFVIQASNFHHAKGGVREPILLGDHDSLMLKARIAMGSNLALFVCLLVTGSTFLFLYVFSRRENSMLHFSALCFTWGVRSLFSNRYVAVDLLPELPWELCVKVEYITLYLMMIWAILFIGNIFKNDVSTTFKYLFCTCNGIFVVLTIFFDAAVYTQFLPVYLSFAVLLLIFTIYILIRALVYEREGVWLMIGSLFVGVILFSYDIIAYEGFATFNAVIVNLGYLMMFLLMTICLLVQVGYLKRTAQKANILTYEDLYGSSKDSSG
jgi:hypothetical protein